MMGSKYSMNSVSIIQQSTLVRILFCKIKAQIWLNLFLEIVLALIAMIIRMDRTCRKVMWILISEYSRLVRMLN